MGGWVGGWVGGLGGWGHEMHLPMWDMSGWGGERDEGEYLCGRSYAFAHFLQPHTHQHALTVWFLLFCVTSSFTEHVPLRRPSVQRATCSTSTTCSRDGTAMVKSSSQVVWLTVLQQLRQTSGGTGLGLG